MNKKSLAVAGAGISAIGLASADYINADAGFTYDEADIAESAVNTIVKVFIAIGIFITIIVIAVGYRWIRKKV